MKILLGIPSAGLLTESAAQASWLCSLHHEVIRLPSTTQGLNFNALWCAALNAGMRGEVTHFAMMHADVQVIEDEPGMRWLDRLMEEMELAQVPFLSTPVAIKDARGLTSCGIGDANNHWTPYKRFTVKELGSLPLTFRISDTLYTSFLLHNEALCLFDLRDWRWYMPACDGTSRVMFNVHEEIKLVNGQWVRQQETEDWSFSRNLWEAGIPSAISRRVKVLHHGGLGFPNWGDHGYQHGDEDTPWRTKESSDGSQRPTADTTGDHSDSLDARRHHRLQPAGT